MSLAKPGAASKTVTAARIDRVISAVASLIECEDFHNYNLACGGRLLAALDKAAGEARRVRELHTPDAGVAAG